MGNLTLTNSVVANNTTFGISGGGIYNLGVLTLTSSAVFGNSTSGFDGGGIFNEGVLTLTSSAVFDNSSSNSSPNFSAVGGGISNEGGGTVTLKNSTVSGNTDSNFGSSLNSTGGGIFNKDGILTLTNSTISGNTASSSGSRSGSDGGGIYNSGTVILTNSTISGNTTSGSYSAAGGIFNSGTVAITFSTLYGNIAQKDGGGDIATEDVTTNSKGNTSEAIKQSSQVKIRNSIVAGDPAHRGPDIVGMLTSYGYNLFQDNSGATFDPATRTQHSTDKTLSVNDLKIDPVLRDKGGSTIPHTRTHALLPSSPAIDQIPLDACHITVPVSDSQGTPIAQYIITTDQRGMKRPDGNEQFCDIGAYEATD